MKALLLMLMLFQDTSKTAKIYEKIDRNTVQINMLMSKRKVHTLEDIYSLQVKTVKTLNESHSLSKSLLIKQDSTVKALNEQKEYTKEILSSQSDLKSQVLTFEEFKEQIVIFHTWMRNMAFFASIGTLILFLMRVSMKKESAY